MNKVNYEVLAGRIIARVDHHVVHPDPQHHTNVMPNHVDNECPFCGRIMARVWHEGTKKYRRECILHPMVDGIRYEQTRLSI